MIPTLRHYGLRFFTENQWNPQLNLLGISEVLLGTVEVALIALVFAFPLALAHRAVHQRVLTAWLRGFLVSMVDLMAAIPSIVYGVWGVFLINPHALYLSGTGSTSTSAGSRSSTSSRRPARAGLHSRAGTPRRRSSPGWSSR